MILNDSNEYIHPTMTSIPHTHTIGGASLDASWRDHGVDLPMHNQRLASFLMSLKSGEGTCRFELATRVVHEDLLRCGNPF